MKALTVPFILVMGGAAITAGRIDLREREGDSRVPGIEPSDVRYPGDAEEFELAQRMERRREAMMNRWKEKRFIVTALLREEIDLPAAAERFRELDLLDPSAARRVRAKYPGASETERYHREVVALARVIARTGDPPIKSRLQKLERQLSHRFPVRGS